eukprot:1713114-Pyramimonas_sp.AAC.1
MDGEPQRFGSLPLSNDASGTSASGEASHTTGMSARLSTALKENFGFDTFRPSQEQAIRAVRPLESACICICDLQLNGKCI